MGYSDAQVADLEATLAAVDADAVVCGTPFDLGRVVRSRHPIRRVTYEVREVGEPDLATVVGERMARWDRGERTGAAAHR
jgi:predicted GTPase